MAVAIDAVSHDYFTGATSATLAHTVAGSNRFLLVMLANSEGTHATEPFVTGVTYNGVAMTFLGSHHDQDSVAFGSRKVSFFGLVAPATGANNVVVSYNLSSVDGVVGIVSLTGVDQTGPTGSFQSKYLDNSTSSIDVPSVAGEMVIDMLLYRGTFTFASSGASQTNNFTHEEGAGPFAVSTYKDGAATTTLTETINSSGRIVHAAIPIRPVGGAWGTGSVPTFDAGSSRFDASGATTTLALTVGAGANRYLLVGMMSDTSETPTDLDYAGVNMTLIDGPIEAPSGGDRRLWLYGLAAPATGANNIVATWSGSSGSKAMGAAAFAGVDQAIPISSPDHGWSIFSTSLTLPARAPSTSRDLCVDVAGWWPGSNALSSHGGSQTENFTEVTGGPRFVGTRKAAAAGSTAMTEVVTTTTGAGVVMGIALRPIAVAVVLDTVPPARRRMLQWVYE